MGPASGEPTGQGAAGAPAARRPVLVIEHAAGDGPARFGEWLAERGRPLVLVRVHAGDRVPDAIADYAGLCVLGGPMSANDALPWLADELALIRRALAASVPVIGHCLGAQLLAKALGGTVARSPEPEIGWHPLSIAAGAPALDWFGDRAQATVLQWHREAFTLPAGAVPLASSAACPQQAFVVDGRHLGVQFHPEADAAKIMHWIDKTARAAAARAADPGRPIPAPAPTIHDATRIIADTDRHLAEQRALAFRLYDRWGRALDR